LAEGTDRFITNKTLLLSESGIHTEEI